MGRTLLAGRVSAKSARKPPLGPGAERPKGDFRSCPHLPSPSRHIYKSLTIAVAFRGSSAFDRVWQHLIKVDGTFA
jgi:hypothetical protein